MGLDTSHDCWHGSYGAFMRWRCKIAEVAGLPPLQWMEGFYNWSCISSDDAGSAIKAIGFESEHAWSRDLLSAFYSAGSLPIKWECLKPSPLHILLNHSDTDGEIRTSDCNGIADALEELITKLPDVDAGGHIGNWREKTRTFVDGLRLAAKNNENVDFH